MPVLWKRSAVPLLFRDHQNPAELATALTGKPVERIQESGAPRGKRYSAVYNPPVVNRQLGIRKSALGAARDIAARFLEKGLETIVFSPSRLVTEVFVTRPKAGLSPPQWGGFALSQGHVREQARVGGRDPRAPQGVDHQIGVYR